MKTAPKVEIPEGPRNVGYARVSTEDQNLNMQLDALRRAGVMEDNLHHEKLSAVAKRRPALEYAIMDLHEGDTFCVWKLDRLARNMDDLQFRLRQIKESGCQFRSLTEAIDTNTPAGQFLMYVMGAVAQFERDLTAERTKKGMAAAQERGLVMGAALKMTPEKRAQALKLLRGGKNVAFVAAKLKVSKPSIYGYFIIKHRKNGNVTVTAKRK